jgi:carboxynorspermidine decarboxylase
MSSIDFNSIPSPSYVCEERLLRKNLETLNRVQDDSGAKILCALKGFAMFSTFDLVSKYLYGCCASGLNEAKLARYEMNKEVHTYSPAFKESEIDEIVEISDHIVFNSFAQFKKYESRLSDSISCGIRVNPNVSTVDVDLYNPCGLYSRLGCRVEQFDKSDISRVDGLHFHALCEQNVDALETVLEKFESDFGDIIPKMKWINFGGGHHITRADYNVDRLIDVIKNFKDKYKVEVYLEVGEAVGWQCGFLVATVLDIVHNGVDIAILDTSAEAHMPDTILMPYKAKVRDASEPNEKKYNYRLAGNTCLAGDVMGDYSFDKKLEIGDKIIFEDQIHYTFVKNTTFNGINLPSLVILRENNSIDVVKNFGYEDYRDRLS